MSVEWFPMPGRVVVRLLDEQETTRGGIIIPAQARGEKVIGKIIAIGEDEDEGEFWHLALDDIVVFGRSSGVSVEVAREKVLILHTNEILTKVKLNE